MPDAKGQKTEIYNCIWFSLHWCRGICPVKYRDRERVDIAYGHTACVFGA